MGREIERKYLLRDSSWRELADPGERLVQGYLSVAPGRSVRVRIQGDRQARLTIKGPSTGPSRPEYEYDIPLSDARELLGLCLPALIEKTRHNLTIGELTWEIDEFEGANAGLVLAEVELDDPGIEPPRPSWVGAEVTGDRRYANSSLSQSPWPEWAELEPELSPER